VREEIGGRVHLSLPADSSPPIASRKNPLIRRIGRLDRDPAIRQEEQLYLLWGWKMVEEGLREPQKLECLLVGARLSQQAPGRALLRRLLKEAVPVSRVEEEILDDLAPGAGDQGVLALARMGRTTLPEMLGRARPLLLVADRIQDPGNMGTMVRLAEAAGVSGFLILPGTVDPYHTRAVRASAGSILRVPVARLSGVAELLADARGRKLRVAVTLPEGGTACDRADLRGAVALVVGNEGDGVSREWIDAASMKLSVVLEGAVQSLNVALATAMVLYEASRQRRGSREGG